MAVARLKKTDPAADAFLRAKAGFLYNYDKRGRWPHLVNLIGQVWQEEPVEWNPWLQLMLRSLVDEKYASIVGKTSVRVVCWTGAGSGGKTFASALFAMAWFLASPSDSCVTLTSTSKSIIGKRVWPPIQHFFMTATNPDTGGPFDWHLIDSMKELQWPRGDGKHSVAAFAVESGEMMKSVEKIKGRHTPRMLVIVDEANTTPEAIFRAVPNMKKGCRDFTLLVIGNAVSHLDNHGRACEPRDGWESISVESDSWITKGVPEWEMEPGICLHFDGKKSPNVLAGKTVYPHIFRYEDYERAVKNGLENSVEFWSQTRGFWPPDGVINSVLSETMIRKYGAAGRFTFHSERTPVATLDPAFGGDACVAVFGALGDIDGTGRKGLQIVDHEEIHADATSDDEIDYQVARRFIALCIEKHVEPRCAGILATGTGRGVYAIVAQEWSHDVIRIEEGGAPSELASSETDARPSYEIYDRRVTELYFTVREFVMSGQLGGLYPAAIVQFVTREYEMRGKKFSIEQKVEYKKRTGRSPDDADAVAAMCEVARRNGTGTYGKTKMTKARIWTRLLRDAQQVYANAYEHEDEFVATNDT